MSSPPNNKQYVALRESESRFRQVAEHSREGIFVESEGLFRYLNPAAVRLFRAASAEQLIGQPVIERIHADRRLRATETMRLVSENRETLPLYEEKYLKLDGRVFDVEVSMAPIPYESKTETVVYFRDITTRKRGTEQQSRAILYALMEAAQDSIYVKDREGRYLILNKAASRLVGKTQEEILGRDDTALFVPGIARAGMENDRKIMATRTVQTRQDDLILASGDEIAVLTTEGPVVDALGDVIGLFGISRDITEHKRSEKERSRLQEQLQQAQKMESVGRLAGGVAHDFNNLLTVINGYSDLLLGQLSGIDPMHGSITEIKKAGERAAALSQQLLALSRRQIFATRAVDLNEVVADVEKMLRRLIGEDIRLETVLSPQLGRVQADPGQLHQVLMNLAVNARDAMPGGGTLIIETGNVEVDNGYAGKHPELKPGPYVLLTVTDSGIGMTDDVMGHLFEPFFTTKKQGEGTGLGLATVYGIVKQSDGAIWASSEPGRGTTFSVYLPRVGQPAAVPKEVRPPLPTLRGTETILVVEDQGELRRLIEVVLRSYGYRVLEAANAGEALLHAERYAGPIHLLLTDVVMPRMTGPELAGRLKGLRPQMCVLFMSGYSSSAMADHGIPDSPVPFLAKPFSPESLASGVREALGPPRSVGAILVVDDEEAIRSFLRKVLTGVGYEVLEASDGKKAVKLVEASPVDLVITDLAMPEQEGLETIRILRRRHPQLKIIATSGRFAGKLLRVAEYQGADATIAKPIRPDELLELVRRVMAG